MKKLISLVLIVIMLGQNFSATTFEFDENYMSNKNIKQTENDNIITEKVSEDFIKVTSQSNVTLYVNLETGNFAVENTNTEYVWYAIPIELQGKLNDSWVNTIKSPFTINYTTDNDKILSTNMYENNSKFTVKKNGEVITYKLDFLDGEIKFEANIKLVDGKLETSIANDSIVDTEDTKLISINILPFFGAVFEDSVPGYIVNSYGNGVRLNYEKPNVNASQSFEGYYNPDNTFSSKNTYASAISMPLFGLVHGELNNAVAVYSTNGYNDMSNIVYPAGYLTGYTTSYFKYNYRYTYKQELDAGKKMVKVTGPSNQDISQIYDFLDNDNAIESGVAVSFRKHLENMGVLEPGNSKYLYGINIFSTNINYSGLFNKKVALTSFSEMQGIVEELFGLGITGLYNVYGVYGENPYFEYNLDTNYAKVAKDDDRDKFEAAVASADSKVMYEMSLSMVSKDNGDVKPKQSYLQNPSGEYISSYNGSMHLGSSVITSEKQEIVNYLVKNNIPRVSLVLPGYSTNYQDKNSRFNTEDEYQSLVAELKKSEVDVSLYNPSNIYDLKSVDSMVIPSSQTIPSIFDSNVPLMSTVLVGSTSVYGTPLNYSNINNDELLRLIEYGIYPSVDVSSADPMEFDNSALAGNSLANYEYFKTKIISTNDFVQEAFDNTEGSQIVERRVIDENVVQIKYDNGKKIVINYNDNDITLEEQVINGKSYEVMNYE